MTRFKPLSAGVLIALLALAAAAPDAAKGDAARGKELYAANGCGYCHGTAGQGGGGRTGGLRLARKFSAA